MQLRFAGIALKQPGKHTHGDKARNSSAFLSLFWLLTSDRYNLYTNPYNYATTNLTRKFRIPLKRAGIDLDGTWNMMTMTMILRAHTLISGTWPHSLETSVRETPFPSSQILRTFSIPSSARAWTSIILAGKRDSRRHSTTSFACFSKDVVMMKTSY